MNEEEMVEQLNSIRKAVWSMVGVLYVAIGIGAAILGCICALL